MSIARGYMSGDNTMARQALPGETREMSELGPVPVPFVALGIIGQVASRLPIDKINSNESFQRGVLYQSDRQCRVGCPHF